MMAALERQPLRGNLLEQEPMARHTSWRVGGVAERFYQPADIDDLANFLSQLPTNEPLYWVGLGSNLLVRDAGIRGTVVATSGVLNGMERTGETCVRVEAGVSCAKVARFCSREGLAGAEFLSGIPGTFGGALAMNAGCFGSETWELVQQVETLDRYGNRNLRSPDEYQIGYRQVRGVAGEWFVAATLRLTAGESDLLASRIRALLKKRSAAQPTTQPNAGSVFRNPPGDYAARLIETAGLKGRCIGKACVSEKHANFIVNTGGATASDIEALIKLVAEGVEQRHGIHLECEVHIIGEAAA
jgi:UDP-N-acetylmuramate dehydrogenase